MINKFYIKGSCCLLSLSLFATSAFSQDCVGAYESGLSLLKKRTEASVKEAVRKFESAKRCYKVNRDDAGVHNCEEQIAACNQVLNYYLRQEKSTLAVDDPFEFSAAGGEQVIPVKTKRSWNFSGSYDWCSATKEKEGLKIVVAPNPVTVRRSQTITLNLSGKKQLIRIVQEGAEEKLRLSEQDLYFSSDDSEKAIEVISNCEWTADGNEVFWCSIRRDSTHLYIAPSPNDGPEKRSGIISINAGSRRAEIRLVQGVDNFKIFTPQKNDTLVFIPKGGRVEIPVEYTVDKNESEWSVESYPNWCEASRQDNMTLLLKCGQNKMKEFRSGVVQVRKGRRLIPLVIVQDGKSGRSLFGQIFKKGKKLETYQKIILYTPNN